MFMKNGFLRNGIPAKCQSCVISRQPILNILQRYEKKDAVIAAYCEERVKTPSRLVFFVSN